MTMDELEAKLDEEYKELKEELYRIQVGYNMKACTPNYVVEDLTEKCRRVAEEATDLGNVAMMITDKVGGLDG